MSKVEYTEDEMLELFEYIEHFNIHFKLLLRRYKRLKDIYSIENAKDIDLITYVDMILVQLRAICIENERYKNNYTAQILLRKIGEDDLANKIDEMLNEEFYVGSMQVNIRKALKILADEFICHYDNFDKDKSHKISLADIFINRLLSPYEEKNLDYIMKVLIDCIGEGLTIQK